MTATPVLDSTHRPEIRQVAALVGVMIAYAPAVLFGGAHIKSLEIDKKSSSHPFEGKLRKTHVNFPPR